MTDIKPGDEVLVRAWLRDTSLVTGQAIVSFGSDWLHSVPIGYIAAPADIAPLAYAAGIEAAAKWHDNETAKAQAQIDKLTKRTAVEGGEFNAGGRRISIPSNRVSELTDLYVSQKLEHDISATAIRALAPQPVVSDAMVAAARGAFEERYDVECDCGPKQFRANLDACLRAALEAALGVPAQEPQA